jgi:hypothetical protein
MQCDFPMPATNFPPPTRASNCDAAAAHFTDVSKSNGQGVADNSIPAARCVECGIKTSYSTGTRRRRWPSQHARNADGRRECHLSAVLYIRGPLAYRAFKTAFQGARIVRSPSFPQQTASASCAVYDVFDTARTQRKTSVAHQHGNPSKVLGVRSYCCAVRVLCGCTGRCQPRQGQGPEGLRLQENRVVSTSKCKNA